MNSRTVFRDKPISYSHLIPEVGLSEINEEECKGKNYIMVEQEEPCLHSGFLVSTFIMDRVFLKCVTFRKYFCYKYAAINKVRVNQTQGFSFFENVFKPQPLTERLPVLDPINL